MTAYCKFYDEADMWIRIVLSVLWVPAFLYRLFKAILDKWQDLSRLIYLILNVLPIVGTAVVVLDIVWCALRRNLPTCLADLLSPSNPVSSDAIDAEVVEEKESEDK